MPQRAQSSALSITLVAFAIGCSKAAPDPPGTDVGAGGQADRPLERHLGDRGRHGRRLAAIADRAARRSSGGAGTAGTAGALVGAPP
jgi:hypothetical protein